VRSTPGISPTLFDPDSPKGRDVLLVGNRITGAGLWLLAPDLQHRHRGEAENL